MKAFRGSMLVAVLVGMGLVCGQAQAAPLITFKVVTLGAGGMETGHIQLEPTDIGRILEIRVYAMINSLNGDPDGLNKALGSLASVQVVGATDLLGNLAIGTVALDFRAVGWQAGAAIDLGDFTGPGASPQFSAVGDGDMDVGANTTGSSTTGFINAFAGTSVYVPGTEILIYSTAFTVTEISGPLAETEILFVPKYYSGGTTALKNNVSVKVDGTTYALNGNDARIEYSGLGVSIIPEPATMALLGLGGLVALIRRRRA